MERVDEQFTGHAFRGADLFNTIQNQRYLFWLNTGELLDLPQVDPEVSEAAWREIDLFRLQEYTSN